jgi:hypothetical protein
LYAPWALASVSDASVERAWAGLLVLSIDPIAAALVNSCWNVKPRSVCWKGQHPGHRRLRALHRGLNVLLTHQREFLTIALVRRHSCVRHPPGAVLNHAG